MNDTLRELRKKLSGILPVLNERHRRLLVGAEALSLGYGGIKSLYDITGMSCKTVRRGIRELKNKDKKTEFIRVAGGGRKKKVDQYPKLKKIIEGLIEADRSRVE